MKVSVDSIRALYRGGKISLEGVRQAVERGWITPQEYEAATGEPWEGA